jgi:hypothetical protein
LISYIGKQIACLTNVLIEAAVITHFYLSP